MDFLARLGGKKVDPIEEAKKVRVGLRPPEAMILSS